MYMYARDKNWDNNYRKIQAMYYSDKTAKEITRGLRIDDPIYVLDIMQDIQAKEYMKRENLKIIKERFGAK